MDVIGPAQHAVELLRDVGLTADTNTERLNPPCVWVAHDRLDLNTLDGGGDVHLSVFLAVPDHGYDAALQQLQQLLRTVLQVLTPDGEIELNAGLQTSNGTLPAWRFPLIMKASN